MNVQIIFLYQVRSRELIYHLILKDLGPVVQSIVSLTTSLRGHLVKYIPTTLSNTLFAKDSHIFPTKNNSVFVILAFENLTKR